MVVSNEILFLKNRRSLSKQSLGLLTHLQTTLAAADDYLSGTCRVKVNRISAYQSPPYEKCKS